MEPGAEAEKADAEVELGAPGLADPTRAEGVDAQEGRVAVEEAPVKAESEEVPIPIPTPPPLEPTPMPMSQPVPQPISRMVDESIAAVAAGAEEEITITDQDVLFGRGGLTNRHIGNLRYRDIISIHRQDYVRSPKTEKPNVARRIVKAIRTGKNPGRFLRKGDDGKWLAVSDKEAAWKASQALREKSRWRSMRPDYKEESSPSRTQMKGPNNHVAAERRKAKTPERKRKIKQEPKGICAAGPEMNKGRVELKFSPLTGGPEPSQLPAENVPTEVSQISVPPVDSPRVPKQVGPTYMHESSIDIFPRDEDVLFGRGGRTNHHPGNKRLREIVNKYRDTYNQAKKVDKPKVSKLIVSAIRSANPPSRFLRMNEDTSLWEDVGDKRAAEKVSQTLREKDKAARLYAPVVREDEAFPATAHASLRREVTADPTSAVLPAAQAAAEQATDVTDKPVTTEAMTAEAAPTADEEMAHTELEIHHLSPEKLGPFLSPDRLEI